MSDTEIERLRRLVDTLWGELPVDVVITLDPEIVDQCRDIHEQLWHENA